MIDPVLAVLLTVLFLALGAAAIFGRARVARLAFILFIAVALVFIGNRFGIVAALVATAALVLVAMPLLVALVHSVQRLVWRDVRARFQDSAGSSPIEPLTLRRLLFAAWQLH